MKLMPNSLVVAIWCIFRPDASIKSFRDYADKKVIPYIERQLANTKKELMSSGTAICHTV